MSADGSMTGDAHPSGTEASITGGAAGGGDFHTQLSKIERSKRETRGHQPGIEPTLFCRSFCACPAQADPDTSLLLSTGQKGRSA